MKRKIITLKEVFKTSDIKISIYTSIYFILNLIKLFLLPVLTLSIMDNNMLTSSLALVFYFAIHYVLILSKEGLINASNFSRMKRIEDSFFACIKIDYEFFESKKGRDLFSKAVSTTNSSTSPFSMIYLYIVSTLYTLFYMIFVGFYSLKLDEDLFIGNIIFLLILSLTVFFDSLNFSQSYKKIIGIFISKEKNLSYLRKIARIPEKALIFDNFNANDFYQGKYLANEHIIISKVKKITRAMISKEEILNFCKIFLMLIYAYLIIEKNTSLTTIVFIIQFIFVSKNFFNSFFDLSNALDNLQYYFEFLNKARIEGGKVKLGKIEKIEFKNVYFNYEKSNFSLENISFKLEKNKKIGIFGSKGAIK